MTDPWADVPDVTLDGRTIPPYQTYGPGDGRSWREYFADLKRKFREEHEENSEDDEVVITLPAEEFDEPCGPLAAYVKLAHGNGWEIIMLGHSLAFSKGGVYKSGKREGQRRPDENIEQQWLYAKRRGIGGIAISYTIVNGTVRGNMTSRLHNSIWNQLSDADMKALIKS